MRKKYLIVCGTSLCIVALVVAVRWFSRPTVESVAYRAIDCALAGDGNCLYEYLTVEELAAYGLDKPKFERFCDLYVRPALATVRKGKKEASHSKHQGTAVGSEEVTFANGKKTSVLMEAALTDSSVKCPQLITTLLMTVAVAKFSDDGVPTKGAQKVRIWIKQIEVDRNALTALGIRGVYRSADEGLLTWDQWESKLSTLLAKVESKSAGG